MNTTKTTIIVLAMIGASLFSAGTAMAEDGDVSANSPEGLVATIIEIGGEIASSSVITFDLSELDLSEIDDSELGILRDTFNALGWIDGDHVSIHQADLADFLVQAQSGTVCYNNPSMCVQGPKLLHIIVEVFVKVWQYSWCYLETGIINWTECL